MFQATLVDIFCFSFSKVERIVEFFSYIILIITLLLISFKKKKCGMEDLSLSTNFNSLKDKMKYVKTKIMIRQTQKKKKKVISKSFQNVDTI